MFSWVSFVSYRYTLFGGVSMMSLVSISGLVMSVAVLILVLSVINGFEKELRERVLGVLPHGIIESRSPMKNYEELALEITKDKRILNVAPYVNGSGLLVANDIIQGINYSGILPRLEEKISIVNRFIDHDSLDVLKPGDYSLVMGKALAVKLNVGVGDKVNLVLPEIQFSLAGPLPRLKIFRVRALFSIGADLDKNTVFMHLKDAQVLKRLDGVMGLRLALIDMFQAPEVVQDVISKQENDELHGRTWFATHGNLYNAILMQKSTMFLLLFLLITVAAFNLVSNLVMTVNEKQADIAILRTLGASPKEILVIFILHGAWVGIAGVFAGLLIGLSAAYWASDVYSLIESNFHLSLMDEYFIHYLPSEILMTDVIAVVSVAFLICICASIYPAFKAASSRPVETLQYES